MIANQRDRFAIPRDVAYLNCAYMAPLAHEVLVAMEAGAALKAAPWNYRAEDFFSIPEATRTAFARILGTHSETVAIVPSVSYGLAIAAANLPLAQGQSVVLLADQFPSNVYVWRDKAKAAGARVVHVMRDANDA